VSRTVLGLGPLEAAIMAVAWQPGGRPWVTARGICDRMDYPTPPALNSVSAVVAVLHRKGLLVRRRRSAGRWEYQAARPRDEHIGDLIAALLDAAADPAAVLGHALRRPVPTTASGPIPGPAPGPSACLPPRQRAESAP
jgi:predicted transcriptional regulator